MQNNTTFQTKANQSAVPVQPVQNSFFEAVQTSLFTAPTLPVAPPIEIPPRNVHCDICPERDCGTTGALEARGWGLYGDFEFCPYHEAQA